MATQKLTNFDVFLMHLIRQLSQYSLTKSFRMKLKTTKHHQSHLTEKPNGLSGQPDINIPRMSLWEMLTEALLSSQPTRNFCIKQKLLLV